MHSYASMRDELIKIAADQEEGSFWSKYLLPIGAAGLAGLGTYAALRKFRPSKVKELRALHEQAKNTGFEVATSPEQGRGLRSILFGARDVPAVSDAARKSTVLRHTGGRATTEGTASINTGVLPDALDDKYTFSRIMSGGTGGAEGMKGAIPDTELLGHKLQQMAPEELAKAYPSGFVIKPRTGSMSKAENLLTEATDLKDPRMAQALRSPNEFIIQEKIPIQNEFRVHMVNNVPFAAMNRELPQGRIRDLWNKYMGGGGGAFVPVMGKDRQQLMDFARQSTKHIGDTAEGNILGKSENLHHALDIARLPDGSFKVIESNPTPGTLMNPIISRKLQQQVTGRVPKDVAALGGGGAALGAGGATYGAMNALEKPEGSSTHKGLVRNAAK